MPLIPIMPQRKIKNRLLFSLEGDIKVINSAATVPIMRLIMLLLFHFRIRFPTKYIEAIIRPKKKAQIRIGKCENRAKALSKFELALNDYTKCIERKSSYTYAYLGKFCKKQNLCN